jgi:hypothetical protein
VNGARAVLLFVFLPMWLMGAVFWTLETLLAAVAGLLLIGLCAVLCD